jgi:uncharacterized protein YdhG (YjbR/CyaY superfamily)
MRDFLLLIINNMSPDIHSYNISLPAEDARTCDLLATHINLALPEAESKIWHRHPVWFLDGNPVVGYAKLKASVQLLFWSGQSFEETGLEKEGSFKAAQARFTSADQINTDDLARWLKKSRDIQWDYKNIIKRKGQLERLR